jgi:hypothetical protein
MSFLASTNLTLGISQSDLTERCISNVSISCMQNLGYYPFRRLRINPPAGRFHNRVSASYKCLSGNDTIEHGSVLVQSNQSRHLQTLLLVVELSARIPGEIQDRNGSRGRNELTDPPYHPALL